MKNSLWARWGVAVAVVAVAVPAFAQERVSTREDRKALFDYLIQKTIERGAFSPVKNENLGFCPICSMRSYEDEVVNASTEEELFYALVKMSNARNDRHLRVSPVEGGLRISESYNVSANSNYPDVDAVGDGPPTAPIKFLTDFGAAPASYPIFVADFSVDIEDFENGDNLNVGDVVTAVNGVPIREYVEKVRPYIRYSSVSGFRFKFAQALGEKTAILPESFFGDDFQVSLFSPENGNYTVRVPYVRASRIEWQGHGARKYNGFKLLKEFGIFDLYRHAGGKDVVLLSWRRFGGSLVADMDALTVFAEAEDLLDHDVIWDWTASRGGGLGAYAIQRLSPKKFKTTFGNLRLSDTTLPFIERKRQQIAARNLSDGAPEALDNGTWLMEWLEGDVMKGLEAGQAYSNDVPFKTAHAPEWSDGVIHPAETHFTGKMVCLLGPYGGSHLDQAASIVADNNLGTIIGMPAGGYSNTWEWDEVVHFPISGQPVVEFMWDIGHTIRPNGQILEGNPADVDISIPVTRQNYVDYYPILKHCFMMLITL